MGTKILTIHGGSLFPNERLNDTRKPISQLAGETLSQKKSKLNSEPGSDNRCINILGLEKLSTCLTGREFRNKNLFDTFL